MSNKPKIYPKHLVVMSNRMINALTSMSANEKRIFYLASFDIRNGLDSGKDYEITAERFAKECNIEIWSAYKALRNSCDRLFQREISYIDRNGHRVRTRWAYKVQYKDAAITLTFPEEVITMLSIFSQSDAYTKLLKSHVLRLQSSYSQRFYELMKEYETIGYREFTVEEIRELFELGNKYKILADLKKRVIQPALDEINQKLDVIITYENKRKGRRIGGFKFIITNKSNAIEGESERRNDTETRDWLAGGLTDKQINFLARNNDFIEKWANVGETWEQAQNRIRRELSDPKTHKKFGNVNHFLNQITQKK